MTEASRYTPDEPIAAIATALAPSALAVVRVSGKGCIELVSKVFSRPKALLAAEPYTMLYGWIVDPEDGSRIDEVMIGIYKGPKSFTGEDMVEITCHGGSVPVLAIYNLLLANGFRAAERGEYSFRAFVNGKLDLTRAEAIREIIDSRTDSSRGRAAGRLSGSLYNEIEAIKQLLIRTTASIEAEIEYPEDENAIGDAYDNTELMQARDMLISLSESWAAEKLYQDGARVVLAGRTNAGKSSLFNTLLKEDRAIVSDIEGTTRDYIESWVSFAGIPARLFDTAGLRLTSDTIEATGVERSRELAGEADLVLYLADSTIGLTDEDYKELAALSDKSSGSLYNNSSGSLCNNSSGFLSNVEGSAPHAPIILVWNKCDASESLFSQQARQSAVSSGLSKGSQPVEATMSSRFAAIVSISAKTGTGVADLTNTVKDLLSQQTATSRAQAGLGSQRQKTCVDDALASVEHALAVDDYGLGLDAAVQDIEDAMEALGEITGAVSPDDILGNIFSRFCVGK